MASNFNFLKDDAFFPRSLEVEEGSVIGLGTVNKKEKMFGIVRVSGIGLIQILLNPDAILPAGLTDVNGGAVRTEQAITPLLSNGGTGSFCLRNNLPTIVRL